MDWLIATDLDGTLLDDGYPLAEAAQAVDALHERIIRRDPQSKVLVVLASSKTCAELIPLADRCASAPLILFENGAGWAQRTASHAQPNEGGAPSLRGNHFERRSERGRPALELAAGARVGLSGSESVSCEGYRIERLANGGYADIRALLAQLRRHPGFDFLGFGDWSAAEVAACTGLDEPAAQAAKQRTASEPILWQGGERALQAFNSELERNGLSLTQGGRFQHVAGPHSKGAALAQIEAQFESPGRPLFKLACGDAANDLDMLRRADLALVFPSRDGGYILPQGAGVAHAPSAGPESWLAGATRLIESQYPQG